MHLALTDAVDICGGSRKLLKILNRVGTTCSADTHDWFVTHIAEMQREKRVWDDLSSDVFTVVSADNFDLLQSHVGLYCGDQHRSYHGTTIQIVQPNPAIHTHTSKESQSDTWHLSSQSESPLHSLTQSTLSEDVVMLSPSWLEGYSFSPSRPMDGTHVHSQPTASDGSLPLSQLMDGTNVHSQPIASDGSLSLSPGQRMAYMSIPSL